MSEETKSVSVFEQTANQVQSYAKRIVDSERAGQYWTQISVMAKANPAIKNARPDSLITAMLACIHLDLMPNTPEQLAHIIPYGQSVQFQIGYKGLLRLAQRSGQILRVNAEVVYEGDEFDYELGLEPKLRHKPTPEVDRTNVKLITHAYAVVKLSNGESVFTVMTRSELDKIKDFAKASTTDAPWNKWYAEQCKKTVLKRVFKLIPSSTTDNRLELAAQYDSWAEASKLRHVDESIIEGEVVGREDASELRRQQMEKAEAERIELAAPGFQPETVEVTEESGEPEQA